MSYPEYSLLAIAGLISGSGRGWQALRMVDVTKVPVGCWCCELVGAAKMPAGCRLCELVAEGKFLWERGGLCSVGGFLGSIGYGWFWWAVLSLAHFAAGGGGDCFVFGW